ncbi:MAG: hypothetical protein L6R37_004318 [Teloschistes peruensis]|nr:MAG: hypothetical protein L6R37_004318 [Teloschistes peruensis]
MEATVRMGIHYLWIDSLCIIQDLEENWNRESKMMGAIYEHAFCNLAAAKASNSDEAEGVTDEFGPVSRDLIHLSANSIKIHYDNILILYAYRFRLDIETLQAGRTLVYMIVEFDDDEKRTRGLLLEQTTGSRGEYPRIGTLNVYDPKVEDSRAETSDRSFLEACDNNQTLLELTEDDYESIDEPSEDGVEMDRITLVLYPLMNGSKLSNHHATIASDSDALYSSHSKAVYQQQSQSFS